MGETLSVEATRRVGTRWVFMLAGKRNNVESTPEIPKHV